MSKWLKYAAIVVAVLVVLFGAAQLYRPDFTSPSTDPHRTIAAQMGKTSVLAAVLERSCRDCHSNETRWPSYAKVAPLSWLMAEAVKKGRSTVNFSEWAGYPPEMQQALLAASCEAATNGKMPGSFWISLHPEAQLSAHDIETICTAAHATKAQS